MTENITQTNINYWNMTENVPQRQTLTSPPRYHSTTTTTTTTTTTPNNPLPYKTSSLTQIDNPTKYRYPHRKSMILLLALQTAFIYSRDLTILKIARYSDQ